MDVFKVPVNEIDNRIQRLQQRMQAEDLDGLLVIQRVDLFYFSGTAQNAVLFIPAQGEPLLCVRRYLPRAKEESPLKNIVGIGSINALPRRILDFQGRLPQRLGFELDVMPVREFEFYRRLFPGAVCLDGAPLILDIRKIKSAWEIEQMGHTAEMSRQTFAYMQTAIRSGLTEMEFAGLFETYARKLGHGAKLRTRHFQTEAYPWHVLSGESGGKVGMLDSPFSGQGTSAAFPCGAGNRRLAENEPILVDFGAVSNGYHMDETRMFAIGSMPEPALKVCRVAIDIHQEMLAMIRPGLSLGDLFEASVHLAKSYGYAQQYLGPAEAKVTFVGHGIGLELIEPPYIARGKTEPLAPGMTFALEPKFCFENAFAAGIESVFLVTDTGGRMISRTPVEVFVCRP